MYNGKEVCQGCKKPGTELERWSKADLCKSCDTVFKTGLDLNRRSEIKESYTRIFQHHHSFRSNELNSFLHEFLTIVNNPHVLQGEGVAGPYSLGPSGGSNGKFYTIPNAIIEPLTKFLHFYDNIMYEYSESKLDDKTRQSLKDVKNEIFNEGVEKGRNLLVQFNNGEITMDQFSSKLYKF